MSRPTDFNDKMNEALRLLFPTWDTLSDSDKQAKFFALDVGIMAAVEVGLVCYKKEPKA